MTTIGFLGFGEAGSAFATGFLEAGYRDIVAYDIAWQRSSLVQERAARLGVDLLPTPTDLPLQVDLIISAVVCTEAEAAARSLLPSLADGQWFLDINSVAPLVKRTVATLVEARHAHYVDVAVMANVTSDLTRLPLLLAGRRATHVFDVLEQADLRASVVSDEPGAAARVKLCRSLLVKGLEALSLEAMLAGYAAGVHEQVLASLDESFGDMTIGNMVRHLLGRHAVHGERRAHELREVAATLREVGIDPLVTEASFARMICGVDHGLQDHFDGRTDPPWADVVATLHSLVTTASGRP